MSVYVKILCSSCRKVKQNIRQPFLCWILFVSPDPRHPSWDKNFPLSSWLPWEIIEFSLNVCLPTLKHTLPRTLQTDWLWATAEVGNLYQEPPPIIPIAVFLLRTVRYEIRFFHEHVIIWELLSTISEIFVKYEEPWTLTKQQQK